MDSNAQDRSSNRRLVRQKLPESLAQQLLRDIRGGVYRDGDLFPSEHELMEVFGVGRSTVREALGTLTRLGFIDVRSGQRGRVQHPTAEHLLTSSNEIAQFLVADPLGAGQFHEFRQVMEVGMARRAAELVSASFVERLHEILERNRAAISDQPRFVETDFEFHQAISTVTDNPVFPAFIKAMSTWLYAQRTATASFGAEEQCRISYEFHERIFHAIAAGDSDVAGREMSAHLSQVNDVFLRSS
ncbi:hypothetical protein ASE63_16830 [Bosea sp. Root381]|uniref:FCD domain-containing protein n=1 Tax=Bosea sp. Root381 TaxID=1736524 RepID=UPI0007017C33|nr:FCD domain-containing protein [Bosea sp. Root381]KRE15882.1 hypothetical protein ASE63_16830 [Bosea sp. Root381]